MYLRVRLHHLGSLRPDTNTDPSIFIIHGLHGGATKTWRHPDSGNIWFRDLLPDLIRTEGQGGNARIWTYGYPASVAFQTSTIYDFAQALLNRVKDVRKDNNVSLDLGRSQGCWLMMGRIGRLFGFAILWEGWFLNR
jgi:hypothetical protein